MEYTLQQKQALAMANARKRQAMAQQSAPTQIQQLTPAQEFANEHPIARTVGRAGRSLATGLSSLPDIPLLVPKTLALMGSMAGNALAEPYSKMFPQEFQGQVRGGVNQAFSALENLGRTPTMADQTRGLVDQTTGGRLAPTGMIDKIGDFGAEMISSAVPFSKANPSNVVNTISKPPSGGTLPALLDPETALSYMPKTPAQKTALLPKISDEGKAVAQLAQKYKIPLGVDDLTDSPFYKTLIAEGQTVPFSGARKNSENQMRQFTMAVSKSIGAKTDKITPDIIDARFSLLGKEFDDFFKGKKINLGEDFGLGLRQDDFIKEVADNYAVEGKSILNKYMGQINETIKPNGIVDGEALGKVRARVSKIARESKNPEISSAARDIENFIIDSVSEVSDKGAKEAFKKTKYQYKNLIAIEPLAAKDQIRGQISPAQLLGRVRQVYGRNFSKGNAGELGDLANIGQYIKETIPNSGTSQRVAARNILTGNLGVAPFMSMANPLVGAAQVAATGAGMVGNRALQNRNFDQELLDLASKNVMSRPLLSAPSSLGALAITNSSGQKLLAAPESNLVKFSKKVK